MNLSEFLEKLEKTRNGWKNRLHNDGLCSRQLLRKRARSVQEDCPVTAVCLKAKRVRFQPWQFEEAAASMGLSSQLANRIVEASDDKGEERLRSRLLKAVGLK